MSLNADKINDDISLVDDTTIIGEISDTPAFAKFDSVAAKPSLEDQWRMKNSVQKARAVVFDVLYGTGAHLKALTFLNDYKIPKKFYSDGESSNEDESMSSGSDINDEITSSSGNGYGFNSAISFSENRTFFHGDKQIDGSNVEVACDENNNDSMMDILVITAEDEDLPLPSPL